MTVIEHGERKQDPATNWNLYAQACGVWLNYATAPTLAEIRESARTHGIDGVAYRGLKEPGKEGVAIYRANVTGAAK
jgi:hypothetical protein